MRRSKKCFEVDSLSDRLSSCFDLGFILIKQLLWKGAIENKSSEWVLCELRGSAAVTRRKKTCNLLQRKVLCFSGHCQGSKSKSRIIYNTRHICWKTTVMLRPLPPPAPNVDSRITYLEWAISDFPGPQYQNEVKCSAFDMEMILYSHANKTHFTRKIVHLASFWKWGFLELGSGLLNSNLSIGQGEKKYSWGNVKYVGWVVLTWKILTFSLLFQRNLTSIVGHFFIAVPYIDWEATLHSSRTSTF